MDLKGKKGFQRVESPEIAVSGVRKIMVLGDPGCTTFSEVSKKVLARILERKADLFFILGDLAFIDAEEEFREIITFCNARAKVPIFALRGNHDLTHYSSFLGRETYALVLDRIVCFFLCDGTGLFSTADLDFLKKTLEKHRDKKFLVQMHIPPPSPAFRWSIDRKDWEELKAVLDPHKERIQRILCGHVHVFYEYEVDGYRVTITAGGGAAMIHDVKAPAQKIFHSLEIALCQDGSITSTVLPVK